MKRLYIITGAAGHLGGTIIRCLRREDCEVRGLILPAEQGVGGENIRYYSGDVTRPETLDAIFKDTEGREVIVIHTAGIISISDGEKELPRLRRVNVDGTRNIIAKCREYGVRRLIYVSSVHAIPEKPGRELISEVSYFTGSAVEGAYAASKAEATQAVLDAAAAGLDAVVVHPSGIIGPFDEGNNHLVQLIKMYMTGKLPAGVRGGYDFVDVRDVAWGCISAADRGESGSCYILSGRYATIRELLELTRRASNGRKKFCLPAKLAAVFAPAFELYAKLKRTRPLYTRYALYTLQSNANFTHSKATHELDYNPRPLAETVADTVNYLKSGNAA